MRNTKNWKHTTKNRKQYTPERYSIYSPYYPVSYYGGDKRNTEFMDLSDIDEEEV